MIKIKITIAFLFVSILSNAQDILSLEQAAYYIDNELDVPEDVTKIYDLNNTVDSFIGNWTGVYNGRTIVFRIYKTRVYNPYSEIEADYVNVKYDITDSSGNVVVSSAQSGLSEFRGISYGADGFFELSLQDACENTRNIYIKTAVPQQNHDILGAPKTELQVIITQGSPQGITSDPPDNSPCTSTADYLPNGAMLILNKV
ncbi:hypothetical protein [Nonlabens ulvanivorans]|uniref:Uncharacterized protein n=1 Tax=Nonlabens ulvanivorans TaxID=906888 RepID=A0A084JU86_NONUL|nr:hypothetical protein [Nonlabens ulvanivorans]KEZ92520.1 hypothetical protein IL45_10245 [Nonlabens ulvanivorans]PRX15358.1 hypothetical protein LY02_00575 [Nonlabens ulvanivorans]